MHVIRIGSGMNVPSTQDSTNATTLVKSIILLQSFFGPPTYEWRPHLHDRPGMDYGKENGTSPPRISSIHEGLRRFCARFHQESTFLPLGCIPQRNRRSRIINDLTFYNINEQTVCMAPTDAMQFSIALERVLTRLNMPTHAMGM